MSDGGSHVWSPSCAIGHGESDDSMENQAIGRGAAPPPAPWPSGSISCSRPRGTGRHRPSISPSSSAFLDSLFARRGTHTLAACDSEEEGLQGLAARGSQGSASLASLAVSGLDDDFLLPPWPLTTADRWIQPSFWPYFSRPPPLSLARPVPLPVLVDVLIQLPDLLSAEGMVEE